MNKEIIAKTDLHSNYRVALDHVSRVIRMGISTGGVYLPNTGLKLINAAGLYCANNNKTQAELCMSVATAIAKTWSACEPSNEELYSAYYAIGILKKASEMLNKWGKKDSAEALLDEAMTIANKQPNTFSGIKELIEIGKEFYQVGNLDKCLMAIKQANELIVNGTYTGPELDDDIIHPRTFLIQNLCEIGLIKEALSYTDEFSKPIIADYCIDFGMKDLAFGLLQSLPQCSSSELRNASSAYAKLGEWDKAFEIVPKIMEVARIESFFDVFYSPEYGGYTTIARQAALAGCKEVAQKAIDLEIEETKETTFFLDTLTYAAEVYFILGNDRNLYGTIDRIFSQNPVHANSDNSPCLIRCADILAQKGDHRMAEDILFSVLNQTRTYILSMMQVYISYGLAFGSRELKLIRDGKNYFINHSIFVTSDIRTGTNAAVI